MSPGDFPRPFSVVAAEGREARNYTTELEVYTCCPECGSKTLVVSGDVKPSDDGSMWEVELLSVVNDESGKVLSLASLEEGDRERAKDLLADMAHQEERRRC